MDCSSVWLVIINLLMQALLFPSVNLGFGIQETQKSCSLMLDGLQADLPDAFLRGLSSARLPGRAQIVYDPISKSSNTTTGYLEYYLDGAHSPESMDACARWFSKTVTGHHKSASLSSLKLSSEYGLGEAFSENGVNAEKANNHKNAKQILLFNCMEVRNPQVLLPQLVKTCASSGVHFSGALFVPSISTYTKVLSGSSITSVNMPSRDLSWQFNLQRIWEKTVNGKDIDLDRNSMECMKTESTDMLPPLQFLHSDCNRELPGGSLCKSAVIPSLSLAIKCLRDSVRENPSIRLQVLVTGSLHLVGDVLKLLRR